MNRFYFGIYTSGMIAKATTWDILILVLILVLVLVLLLLLLLCSSSLKAR